MRPVRAGDRGPAVEDIQRRLRILGYELGPTGVDGVFFGQTESAVRSFQQEHALTEDGFVGSATWAALVDATFTLGDRMLYLRLPHFHGNDVRVAQQALNALGFACGAADGIFGTFTERGVREFQRNAGLPADGIVGPETATALRSLRHVWEGKNDRPHSEARLEPARRADVLARLPFAVGGLDDAGQRIAGRLVNLALAAEPKARIGMIGVDEPPHGEVAAVLRLRGTGTASAVAGRPVVRMHDAGRFAARLLTALETSRGTCAEVVVEVGIEPGGTERDEQRAAVNLLDAVCLAFD